MNNLDAITAGFLSLLGVFFLSLSFQATSASISVVTGSRFVALCVGERRVVQTSRSGSAIGRGQACPAGDRHALAEVTRESKRFFTIGWVCVVIGSLWEMWLARRPRMLWQ
jgi:hypothetical protein